MRREKYQCYSVLWIRTRPYDPFRAAPLSLFFIVITGVVAGGWFQAAQQTSAEVPAPTIRVTTHLVLIDAVVTDKQGNPIAGLHPEDFVVEENGKAEKIATFAGPVQSASAPAVSTPIAHYGEQSSTTMLDDCECPELRQNAQGLDAWPRKYRLTRLSASYLQ